MSGKIFYLLLCLLLVAALLGGCGKTAAPGRNSNVPETHIFTDSAGREIEIPKNITKIAPSGSLAQLILFTVCPDKIMGWANEFSDLEKQYIAGKYRSLPIFGQFYGKNVNLNMEALIAAEPDVIIDIGEAKKNIKKDMYGIQEQTGIPVIFIEATLDTMAEAYLALGKLVGEEEQAEKLSTYVKETLEEAAVKRAAIKEEDRISVFYGMGDTGLGANAKGSIHADVIDYIGADNVAVLEQSSGSGCDEVSMEQLMLWNPDVILFAPCSVYSTVSEDPLWKNVRAVKENKYYEVPTGPYNWMGRPPSINRIIGIKWLGNLLYPALFDYDLIAEAKEFYQSFYHYSLSDAEAKNLLSNSTLK